jgi:hypothetical protein
VIFRKHPLDVALCVVMVLAVFAILIPAGVVKVEGLWFNFQVSSIRITTVATAFLSFALVLFLQGKVAPKPLYYAVLAAIFFLALYEIVWYNLAVYFLGLELGFLRLLRFSVGFCLL